MRFADAVSRGLAALVTTLWLGGTARAEGCPPASPEQAEKIKAQQEACQKKAAQDACVTLHSKKGCPLTAVVSTSPTAKEGPWTGKVFHGAGVISCRYALTWVLVEAPPGYEKQKPLLCDLAGMPFHLRIFGESSPSSLPPGVRGPAANSPK